MSAMSPIASTPRVEDRRRSSGGIIHVFSSSYLGRLFKVSVDFGVGFGRKAWMWLGSLRKDPPLE